MVKELTVVLLKALALYDAPGVKSVIPGGAENLMESDDIPMRYGGEYGGLIEEYLQSIVENRRSRSMHFGIYKLLLINRKTCQGRALFGQVADGGGGR